MNNVQFGDIVIGAGVRPLVIPEIGINHGGDLRVAKLMVDAAHRAGARLIKHQTHIVEDEYAGAAKSIRPGNADISIYEVMRRCALSKDEEYELMKYVESKGMLFLSTPFSRAAADRLEEFGVKAFKIGSGELNNYPLLDHIASFGKPMIMSTGMNSMPSVMRAVDILEHHKVPYALMHTTNLYPTKPEQVRLGGMQALMTAFPQAPIGLSDHTVNNNACIAAIALGARVVERHFTDHMDREGPDIVCSMDEDALRELLRAAREVPQMQGGIKTALPEEQVTINFAYASVVTIKPVKAGEMFSKDNLWVKRPGTGEILAEEYGDIMGKTAACDIEDDTLLTRAMVKEWNE